MKISPLLGESTEKYFNIIWKICECESSGACCLANVMVLNRHNTRIRRT